MNNFVLSSLSLGSLSFLNKFEENLLFSELCLDPNPLSLWYAYLKLVDRGLLMAAENFFKLTPLL